MTSLGRLCVVIFGILALSCVSQAQALLTEDFSYTNGTVLQGQGGWAQTGTSGTSDILVSSPGLTYTGYQNVAGNAATLGTSGRDLYLTFANQTTGSVYASMLVNVTTAPATPTVGGDYFFHFGATAGTTSAFYARTYIKVADNGKLAFGICKASPPTGTIPAFTDSIYNTATTYLLVVKYAFGPNAADDAVSIYVFADPTLPASEPGTPNAGPYTSTSGDAVGIAEVCLRQGSASTSPVIVVDGIRVGTSWDGVPLPVELNSFSANANHLSAQLRWSTATETNNLGFDVERKTATTSWSKVGFIAGAGTSSAIHDYNFTDNLGQAGLYEYRIKQIDKSGSFKYSAVMTVEIGSVARKLSLGSNYPNPFNPSTNIDFSVPTDGRVVLKVYNVIGQEVETLFDGMATAGTLQKATFDASRLPSGVYFSRMEFGGNVLTKRMMLIK